MKQFKYLIISLLLVYSCGSYTVENAKKNNRLPKIYPDYINTTIPPNIAPFNFSVCENGSAYHVKIHSKKREGFTISSSDKKISIPPKKWRKLLENNKGESIFFDVSIKDKNGNWISFEPIENKVATSPIDKYLAYRLVNASRVWYEMGLYQRNMENFEVEPVFLNRTTKENCINCHTFCKNNPQKMSMHIRLNFPGTLIISGDEMRKVETKTPYTMSSAVYPGWHPNGNIVSYSVNKIGQYYSSLEGYVSEVNDHASDIILYVIDKNMVTTSPEISTKARENMPSWSPDGKWMYYIMAPEAKTDSMRIWGKYSLMRIRYDAEKNTWGKAQLVLSADSTKKSITFPRISPDGRYLIFAMMDHGYFSINYAESDLYIMDLNDFTYRRMDEMNSHDAESTACWSSSGKWIAIASKRQDGYFSIPYFSYFQKNGKASKPFVLPQEDPAFYEDFIQHFNLPELITDKIPVNPFSLRDFVYNDAVPARFDTTVEVDALSGATKIQHIETNYHQ